MDSLVRSVRPLSAQAAITPLFLMKIPAFADDALLPRVAGATLRGRGAVGTVQPGEPVGTVGQTLHGDVGDAFRAALEMALGDEQGRA